MFRRQILAQLKKDNPGVPETVLVLIADKLAKIVTAEDQIVTEIDKLNDSPISIQDYADFLQREGDRRVTQATRKNPNQPTKEDDDNNPAAPTTKTGDDAQPKSDLDKLTAIVQGLATSVGTLLKDKTSKSMQEKLAEKLPGVPAVFYKGRLPEKEEDFDAAVEEIQADWAEMGVVLPSTTVKKGIKNLQVPASGVKTTTTEDAVDPAILDFAKKQVETAAAVKN